MFDLIWNQKAFPEPPSLILTAIIVSIGLSLFTTEAIHIRLNRVTVWPAGVFGLGDKTASFDAEVRGGEGTILRMIIRTL